LFLVSINGVKQIMLLLKANITKNILIPMRYVRMILYKSKRYDYHEYI
jgi:hypothetical protein